MAPSSDELRKLVKERGRLKILVWNTADEKAYVQINEEFDIITSEVRDYLGSVRAASVFANESTHASTPVPRSLKPQRLPPIAIPSFNGNLIPQDSLKGEAQRVLESVPMSEDNYKEVWELVRSNYGQTNAIVRHHLGRLFELPEMRSRSAAELQPLFNECTAQLKTLESLGAPIQTWDFMILYFLETRFHPQIILIIIL
ncbi:uncharacterized protein LOC105736492, partial [Apis florea]|uniref:uncharacterized protein LOC105736492 n=1 Tax=Apis florea TaxID=7463 RepID=UPI000628FE92